MYSLSYSYYTYHAKGNIHFKQGGKTVGQWGKCQSAAVCYENKMEVTNADSCLDFQTVCYPIGQILW